MTKIHPTAVVEDGARIAASAEIGPFCWISSKAKIGENVRLLARVTVYGDTTIGEGTVVFPGAVLGTGPQDHGNEFQDDAKLVIGKRNVIRENVTMHAGTPKGQSDRSASETFPLPGTKAPGAPDSQEHCTDSRKSHPSPFALPRHL